MQIQWTTACLTFSVEKNRIDWGCCWKGGGRTAVSVCMSTMTEKYKSLYRHKSFRPNQVTQWGVLTSVRDVRQEQGTYLHAATSHPPTLWKVLLSASPSNSWRTVMLGAMRTPGIPQAREKNFQVLSMDMVGSMSCVHNPHWLGSSQWNT